MLRKTRDSFNILIALTLTFLFTATAHTAPSRTIIPEAYVLDTVVWPYDSTTQRYPIPVCWENLSQSTVAERDNVRAAIVNTWQTYSLARFNGWLQCPVSPLFFNGIRITVDNVKPPQAALGREGNGKVGVMRLNFRLNTPVKTTSDPQLITLLARCQRDVRGSTLQTCIQSTAIHEFGHILGLAHEHNRPTLYGVLDIPFITQCNDNDPDPTVIPQGSFRTKGNTLFTDYDPNSVMNYCRNPYFGRRDLSNLDKLAMRVYYGQMPSFDIRTGILQIPRIERYDGVVLKGSFNLLPDGRFQQSSSFQTTTTVSTSPAIFYSNGLIWIPELKYISPSGHVNQVINATLLKTATPGIFSRISWVRSQPVTFSPVPF